MDIPRTILDYMLQIYDEPRKLTLSFGAMICKLLIEAGCQAYTYEMPVSKRQKIDGTTKAISDTHLRGHIQGEQALVQDDEDADFVENRLFTVEHAVFDQSV